jgi:hypothetical protein
MSNKATRDAFRKREFLIKIFIYVWIAIYAVLGFCTLGIAVFPRKTEYRNQVFRVTLVIYFTNLILLLGFGFGFLYQLKKNYHFAYESQKV